MEREVQLYLSFFMRYFILTRIVKDSFFLLKSRMPTVLNLRGYRFFFYSNHHTPAHVHVEKGRSTAKIDLESLDFNKSRRFSVSEIREIRKIVFENRGILKSKWDEYFDSNKIK